MTRSSVIVLGAGMCGVGAACHLLARGFDVTLVDRGPPGRETSYGNAGLIQRECVEPHAFPRDVRTLLNIALGRGNEARYHLAALPGLVSPLARYWWNSRPAAYRRIVRGYEALIRHSLTAHAPLIAAAGAEDLIARTGWTLMAHSAEAFDAEAEAARRLSRAFGVNSTILDAAGFAAAEPAIRRPVAGAIHWTDPWFVRDPGELVARYARLFQRQGGHIATGDAATLRRTGAAWSVETEGGRIDAAAAVIALGPWSDRLLRRFGYRYPLFIKRGYHRHHQGASGLRAPVLDLQAGTVLAPMARGLRLTTGAEFARLGARPTPVQLARVEARARQLVELGAPVEPVSWLGNRPCTPDMLPVIGAAPRHAGLWFHFGHAHQGFTLGPATGQLLAELMTGEAPFTDPAPYAPARFG
ncbi:D-amino acid dehydrogenase small subunit [Gluconacetobacter johannae DSM 13595]|uniref:FAD-binding oxidoreductase n=1 Tax=Gluconacetobacter johannae TaxID=112140 RepID=A0A7W4JA55_9PROT|nr:FAD-dependent oxidoreductase [Gluconacetobacter johannae]MBB2177489.1 FAD-binding oxidoreductase [Gluconacetobacter johannae]GBQ90265.1 D-amino acid dehydrogenase small subunit [Gluconacetobacter johannae DSM 13595]